MTTRRQVLAGLLATGLAARPTWADVGGPAFLSAAGRPDGSFALCGLNAQGNVMFRLPLPARGHAAAAHPTRPEAVAFARRPGTFAIVIDCRNCASLATLNAPQGRHFYGHGVFSQDGARRYTTENDYTNARGRSGSWDAKTYTRIGEIGSGGVGPHDLKRLHNTDTLVVANGGIETHPDSGRTKLNLPTMRPNLSYIEDSQIIEQVTLNPDLHKNSIRHLAVSLTGDVAFGMQWQGGPDPVPLVGLHKRGGAARLAGAPSDRWRDMQAYVGSIAFSNDGKTVAATSPRGGVVQLFDAPTATLNAQIKMADACGIAQSENGLVVTSGTGAVRMLGGATTQANGLMWDNHLIAL